MRYLFVLPPTLILTVWHLYLWLRLIRNTRLPAPARWLCTILLVLLGATIPATFIVWFRIFSMYPLHFMVAYGWLGMAAYATAVLLAWDCMRVVRWVIGRVRRAPIHAQARPQLVDAATQETRRVFVARAVASTAVLTAGSVGVIGVRAALWDITTPEIAIGLARLPRELDGYTIALLTDIHIGPVLDGRFLRHLVEETNRMRPDAIAIGGDLVDGRVIEIGDRHVAELRRLRARDGVYYVTGNHEYYWGAAAWVEFVKRMGVQVLMNERVSLGDKTKWGAQLDLAGVPDRNAARTHALAPDPVAAVLGRDDQRELVMLAHQPIQILDTVKVAPGLQLSGHTHGGQLNPFGAVGALSQRYIAGLHQHPGTQTQIYVSRGTGFWGPPMRVFAPAEITKIRLFRA